MPEWHSLGWSALCPITVMDKNIKIINKEVPCQVSWRLKEKEKLVILILSLVKILILCSLSCVVLSPSAQSQVGL